MSIFDDIRDLAQEQVPSQASTATYAASILQLASISLRDGEQALLNLSYTCPLPLNVIVLISALHLSAIGSTI